MPDVRCNSCGLDLSENEEPAYAFSPPVPHQSLVNKYLVCPTCWQQKFQPKLSSTWGPKPVCATTTRPETTLIQRRCAADDCHATPIGAYLYCQFHITMKGAVRA